MTKRIARRSTNTVKSESFRRKMRTISILESYQIPTNEYLPELPSSRNIVPRTINDIAHRAMCLTLMGAKGEDLEQNHVDRYILKYNLKNYLSDSELLFLSDPDPSDEDRCSANWRYEGAYVMLWALGHMALELPFSTCPTPEVAERVIAFDEMISEASPRSIGELLNQADIAYRCHWAAVNQSISSNTSDETDNFIIDIGVCYQRRLALEWLIGGPDLDWDDVRTDT